MPRRGFNEGPLFGGKADTNTTTILPFVVLKPQKSFGVAMFSKNSRSGGEKMGFICSAYGAA